MWFDTTSDLVRVVLVGTAAYATLVLVLRLTGKRTLAKLNAFDLVVTVTFGSTLATILLSTSVSWSEGAAALALLALLQLAVAALASRFPAARRWITSGPTCLVLDGRLLTAELSAQRVAEAEVRQALRGAGHGGLEGLAAVVLETDGSLSVVAQDAVGDGWALEDLPRRNRSGGPD